MDTDLREELQQTLGNAYIIERELGGGGMSRVFLATDTALGRMVVVKVLPPDLAAGVNAERFARETRLTARLQHPNIVPLLTAGELGGLPYYTMPYVDGRSLRNRLDAAALDNGRTIGLPLGEAVRILTDVARALAYAHRHGVVHRDLKPENVLLSEGVAVVTDFGVAKALTSALGAGHSAGPGPSPPPDTEPRTFTAVLTQRGAMVGTPAYMAPEQAAAEPRLDYRVDLYAWGVVAYEVLAGRHPFANRSMRQLILAHLVEQPVPLAECRSDVPPGLASIVTRCLAKNAAERPPDALAVLATLEALTLAPRGGPPVIASDAPAPARPDGMVVTPPTSTRPSIAVLPFTNLSKDPENEYFSDGVTEEILNALAQRRRLQVAARTSAFAFKGKAEDPRTVAERLGVRTLLEGSVRRSGNRVRISVQLVDATTGFQLWNERYDRELADIFAVQDEIASAIAETLEETLLGHAEREERTPPRAVRADRLGPDELAAYDLVLKGRYHVDRQLDGARKALECFEGALAIDPTFAPAYAGLADALRNLTHYNLLQTREAYPRVRAAAERAIALDPCLADAYVSLAAVRLYHDWDPAGAEREVRRAIALNPNHPLAFAVLGRTLVALERDDDAITASARAVQLDPLSMVVIQHYATVLLLAGRYARGVEVLERAITLFPTGSDLYRWLATALYLAGRLDEAITAARRAVELGGRYVWALMVLAWALAAAGRTEEMLQIRDELVERSSREWIPPLAMTSFHGVLGELDEAFVWLDRSIDARDFWLVYAHREPAFAPMSADPRFAAALRRIGVADRGRDAHDA